ncbi:MAG: hypothetical protein AAFX80_12665 [Cyanobacteria bacterium J06639_18]
MLCGSDSISFNKLNLILWRFGIGDWGLAIRDWRLGIGDWGLALATSVSVPADP